MKLIFISLCLFRFLTALTLDESSISSALSQAIQQGSFKMSRNLDFIVIGTKTQSFFDILENIMQKVNIPHNILNFSESGKKRIINESAVLFFDSIQSYRKVKFQLSTVHFKKLIFIVYIQNGFEKIFDFDFRLAVPFRLQYFLVREREHLKLITFEQFQQPSCRKWKRLEINRFSIEKRKWESKAFSTDKFRNLHRCSILVGAKVPQPPEIDVVFDEKRKFSYLIGYAPKIIQEIGKSLNFTVEFNLLFRDTKIQTYKMKKSDMNLYVTSVRRINARKRPGTTTFPFVVVDYIFRVSRFKPYSFFQKIFLPFEIDVWYWFMAAVSVFFAINFVVYYLSKFYSKLIEVKIEATSTLQLL